MKISDESILVERRGLRRRLCVISVCLKAFLENPAAVFNDRQRHISGCLRSVTAKLVESVVNAISRVDRKRRVGGDGHGLRARGKIFK